jgi:hypothetical protein
VPLCPIPVKRPPEASRAAPYQDIAGKQTRCFPDTLGLGAARFGFPLLFWHRATDLPLPSIVCSRTGSSNPSPLQRRDRRTSASTQGQSADPIQARSVGHHQQGTVVEFFCAGAEMARPTLSPPMRAISRSIASANSRSRAWYENIEFAPPAGLGTGLAGSVIARLPCSSSGHSASDNGAGVPAGISRQRHAFRDQGSTAPRSGTGQSP